MESLNIQYHRPWGSFTVLADETDHKVKRIVVKPGKRLSLQKHQKRSEHWYILSGVALATLDKDEIKLEAGKTIDISKGSVHRVLNPGIDELVFIEVQTGEYFGEDDIERLEDDFDRM